MISVIVLCYNPDLEKLKCTIISIIKQKDVEYELIISDDGSALDYRRELKDWISGLNLSVNVIYNFLPDNVGTVKNMLSAVKLANGEYIKTISPGDYFFNEYSLSVYYSHLCKFGGVVFGKAVYYCGDQLIDIHNPSNDKIYKNSKLIKTRIAVYGDLILGASVAYTREIGLKYLTKAATFSRFVEDQPITMLSCLDGVSITPINQYLVWYEYGTGISTTKDPDERVKVDEVNLVKYIEENYKTHLARKICRSRKLGRIPNKFTRKILRCCCMPSSIVYYMDKVLHRVKLPNFVSVEQRDKIIKLD